MGQVHTGTGTQSARFTMGQVHHETGIHWDRYTVEQDTLGQVHSGTGTYWNSPKVVAEGVAKLALHLTSCGSNEGFLGCGSICLDSGRYLRSLLCEQV